MLFYKWNNQELILEYMDYVKIMGYLYLEGKNIKKKN